MAEDKDKTDTKGTEVKKKAFNKIMYDWCYENRKRVGMV